MRILLTSLLLVVQLSFSFAQFVLNFKYKRKTTYDENHLPVMVPKKHLLPNVVPINGQFLYIAETEVSNLEYRGYLEWLRKKGMQVEYQKALPDSANWSKKLRNGEPYKLHYHSHSNYNEYPAVNISQQQARQYCSWLQDSIMKILKLNNSPIEKIIVRLPTEKEWMMAARKGLSPDAIFPWEEQGIRKSKPEKYKGTILGNFVTEPVANRVTGDYGPMTTPVRSYWPNKIGLWNMSGNVAEWLDESGRNKGGSWHQPPYNCRIDAQGLFEGDSSSNIEIGFRYVIEIVSVRNTWLLDPLGDLDNYMRSNFVGILRQGLYAQRSELTNMEYLNFLKENPDTSLRINNSGWNHYFPYLHYQMYGWQEAYYMYPVVNVSYESALKYCEWLTDKYHKMEKRLFKKVVFRLPTREEWEWAARGGREKKESNIYPWGGQYYKNRLGCYFANFCPLEEQYLEKDDQGNFSYNYPNNDYTISRGVDGRIITVPVYSFFPNDYGLFNCAGNVAEMVAERGISCGGSWVSNQDQIRLDTFETYNEPNPTLGFRVFMEVLEE